MFIVGVVDDASGEGVVEGLVDGGTEVSESAVGVGTVGEIDDASGEGVVEGLIEGEIEVSESVVGAGVALEGKTKGAWQVWQQA